MGKEKRERELFGSGHRDTEHRDDAEVDNAEAALRLAKERHLTYVFIPDPDEEETRNQREKGILLYKQGRHEDIIQILVDDAPPQL